MDSPTSEWLFENYNWVFKNHPEWLFNHYPEWIFNYYPEWLLENQPEWLFNYYGRLANY